MVACAGWPAPAHMCRDAPVTPAPAGHAPPFRLSRAAGQRGGGALQDPGAAVTPGRRTSWRAAWFPTRRRGWAGGMRGMRKIMVRPVHVAVRAGTQGGWVVRESP